MKEYLEKRIAYYKKEIPIMEEMTNLEKDKSYYLYDISMEKLFKMKASLHECERQLILEKNDKTLLLYRGEWDVNIAYQRYDMVYYERVAWIFDSDLSDTTVAGMIPTLKNGWKVEN